MIEVPGIPLEDAAWIFVIVMGLILFVPILFRNLRLPEIVGIVLAGMVVGPGVLGLLEYQGLMRVLGQAGLLYLLFLAGVELNLDDFREHQDESLRFVVLTFGIPLLLGIGVISAMGIGLAAAILLAAAWASHTLLTYPTFRRHGTIRNRAVATAVGAQIFTDTTALLILVLVVRSHGGNLGAGMLAGLVTSLGLLVALTLWVVPRVARWSFGTLGLGVDSRFLFALVILFGAAAAAELGGLEAIMGAFLAGIGMNRLVPQGSALMERVGLFGENFLIPIFLLSVGLLIEPAALTDSRQLALAGGFVGIVVVGKLAAAGLSGLWLDWNREEMGAVYSLTVGQAAAALAIVIVGIEAGVVEGEIVNAAALTILVLCVVASLAGDRYAPRLPHAERARALGEVVVVPVSEPEEVRGLSRIASALAHADGGYVVPLIVRGPEASPEEIERAREMNEEAREIVHETGGSAEPVLRIDALPESGILHTLVEHEGSMLLLGWRGSMWGSRGVFGSTIDAVLSETPVPSLVVRMEAESEYDRVVILVTSSNLDRGGRPSLDLALEVGRRLAREEGEADREFVIVTNTESEELRRMAEDRLEAELMVDRRKRTELARDVVGERDLVVLPVRPERGGIRGAPSRFAQAFPDGPLIVAYNRSRVLDWSAEEVEEVDEAVEDEVEEMEEPDPRTPKVEGARAGEVQVEEEEEDKEEDEDGEQEDGEQ